MTMSSIPRTHGHGGSKQSPRGGHGKPTALTLFVELQDEVEDVIDSAGDAGADATQALADAADAQADATAALADASQCATDIAAIQPDTIATANASDLATAIALVNAIKAELNAKAAVVLTSSP
jgi:hypothetical protein